LSSNDGRTPQFGEEMTVRVFIHLRDDFKEDEHYAILGRLDKTASEVHFLECRKMLQRTTASETKSLTRQSVDGGLIGFILGRSDPQDTCIILQHNPGEKYRELDRAAVHVFDQRAERAESTTMLYIFSHYLGDLEETLVALYFS
jgi:hypothetical protein